MSQTFRSEAHVKHLAEEICEENVAMDSSVRTWCGTLAVTQCGSCTKFLCSDCGHLCRNCREHGKHDKYCCGCINTHKCPGEVEA